MDKEKLVENIKEWVKVDNEIRELKKQQKIRKDKQKELSKMLMEVMRSNEIQYDTISGRFGFQGPILKIVF